MLKKIVISLLLLPLLLSASSAEYEQKIYQTIFSSLFPQKETLYVWSDTPKNSRLIDNVSLFTKTSDINKADILLLSKDRDIKKQTPIFVTNYKLLKSYKQSAIGGFYWKKGRPNIVLLKNNLMKNHISIPSHMQKYIEND